MNKKLPLQTNSDQLPFFDHCFDKNRLKHWIKNIYYETLRTEDLTIIEFIEALKNLGFQEATKAGVSIGIEDLLIPTTKTTLLKEIEFQVQENNREFQTNRLTALENFQNFIDIWHRTSETIKREVVQNFECTDTLNPVYMMAFSGARGNVSQVSQLVGMRGFMSDPEGQIIDFPIRSNFREGLTLTEYVISCYGARKGLVDTALRTADAGYLTRRLVDVAHTLVIIKHDCRTKQGIFLSEIQSEGKTLYSLKDRLVGRVLAQEIQFPFLDSKTNQYQVKAWRYFAKNKQIDLPDAKLLGSCFKRVLVRSPLRCLKKKRLCQLCYGWTLPHAHLAPIGEAVGILAAQSIGEPGTQLTMRTFHTGGVFSGALSEDLKAPYSGIIRYNKPSQGGLFRTSSGQLGFRTEEPATLYIQSNTNQPTETLFELDFPKGSILFLKQFQHVQSGDLLIELPKQHDGGETVLNTYTYYSNRSGFLKLTSTNSQIDTQNNPDLLSHPKVPKIEPFYQKAETNKASLYSLKIHAGQILTPNYSSIKSLLPQLGDLVNSHSVISQAQLINTNTGKLTLEKELGTTIEKRKFELKNFHQTKQDQQQLPLEIQKSIFQLSCNTLKYQHQYGYCLHFKKQTNQFYLAISKLQQKISKSPSKVKLTYKDVANPSLTGNFISLSSRNFVHYPSPTNLEKVIMNLSNLVFFLTVKSLTKVSKKDQRFIEIGGPSKLVKKQLRSFMRLNHLKNKWNHPNYFFLRENKYPIFSIEQKRTLTKQKLTLPNKLGKKINGHLLSSYTTDLDSNVAYTTDLRWSTSWVRKNQQICSQWNLQNKNRQAIAKKSGFVRMQPFYPQTNYLNDPFCHFKSGSPKNLNILTKDVLLDQQNQIAGLSINPKWLKSSSNYYWKKGQFCHFKSGWPISSTASALSEKIFNHKQIHSIGTVLKDNICFLGKSVFSEYLVYLPKNLSKVTKLQSKNIFLRKNVFELNLFMLNKEILLISSLTNFSFLTHRTTSYISKFENMIYCDDIFSNTKDIYNSCKVPYKLSQKCSLVETLLQNANKQVKTTNKSSQICKEIFSLKFDNFSRSLTIPNLDGSGNSPLRCLALKYIKNSSTWNQVLMSVLHNPNWKNISSTFSGENPLQLTYTLSYRNPLNAQNYFKNANQSLDSIYTVGNTKKTKSLSLQPFLLQSQFFSNHAGELILTKNTDGTSKSLLLTNKDSFTLSSNFQNRCIKLGDIVNYRTEINTNEISPFIGQVIHVTKDSLKVHILENSLVASNSRFFCSNNQFVERASKIFTQSYPRLQMGDIVQGIPKIEEFFEARRTKDGVPFKHNLHRRLKKRLRFYQIKCGYPFIIANRKSIFDIQTYIIDSIFKLYKSQGISLSDKHLEIIVKQMTSKVLITQFWVWCYYLMPFNHPLPGEYYSRQFAEKFMRQTKTRYHDQIRYIPKILGITRAALENDGFISAASFQETTRILSRGAVFQKKDYLKGLKENVIVGHIIPSGTAVRTYTRRYTPPIMNYLRSKHTYRVLTINHEWKTNLNETNEITTQYINPIRLTLLKVMFLKYYHTI